MENVITKKYEFTGEVQTVTIDGREITLYRIRSLRDFADVKAGDIGGWIEKEENLSHEGNCWVYGDTSVSGGDFAFRTAWVYGDTLVSGNDRVSGNVYCVFTNA